MTSISYSFKIPKFTDLRIMVVAGQGHQGEWTIRETEMQGLPPKTASQTGTDNAIQTEQKKTISKTSADPGTIAPNTNLKSEEMEAIIEAVLDRKLKPIVRMLADNRQKGPSARDIFAGIGYILGLVGIAAYVHSRKKKV